MFGGLSAISVLQIYARCENLRLPAIFLFLAVLFGEYAAVRHSLLI